LNHCAASQLATDLTNEPVHNAANKSLQ